MQHRMLLLLLLLLVVVQVNTRRALLLHGTCEVAVSCWYM
jgi:hypothetical protein